MPIKSAVFEILPWFFFNWVIKYSFSKCSLASFNGEANDFSKRDLSFSKYEEELYHIMDAIELNVPDQEGYPSDVSGAKREIHKNVRKEWIRNNK